MLPFRLMLGVLVPFLMAGPASAAWLEARSAHFVIDANTSEPRLRDFADRLERFDAALRRLYGIGDDPALRANRLTIFAVEDGAIGRLCQGCPTGVAAFYRNTAGRSVIVTPALGIGGAGDLSPQAALLHEYSHHFMFTNLPGAFPLWYTEGFAEFNATADLRKDGGVVIGLPAQYRAYGLLHNNGGAQTGSLIVPSAVNFTIRRILEPAPASLRQPADMDRFYGKSWLLMHYLMLSPDRPGQLATYLTRIRAGDGSLAAAQAAFGDMDKLGVDLSRYLANNHLAAPLLVPPAAAGAEVEIVPLSPGAAAMMAAHMRSAVGTSRAAAAAALPAIVDRAAPYPDDPRVQVQLAEAAYDAGDDAMAGAAADRALAVDAKDMMALLYKGYAALRTAIGQGADAQRLSAARSWIVKANRIAPDAALPLIAYYQSFVLAAQPPSEAALKGLMRAVVVAPEDPAVRWMLAGRMLDRGDVGLTRDLLGPIAFAPHDAAKASLARQALDKLDAKDTAGAKAILADRTLDTHF